jgi:hypothetical protein
MWHASGIVLAGAEQQANASDTASGVAANVANAAGFIAHVTVLVFGWMEIYTNAYVKFTLFYMRGLWYCQILALHINWQEN